MNTSVYLLAFASVFAVSLISLVGIVAFSWKASSTKRNLTLFISLAAGALMGDAFMHLIPEAFQDASDPAVSGFLVIGGIVAFFILEKFFHWHHHGEDADAHGVHTVGKLVILSDVLHNFFDGVIIAASFLVSVPVGIATTVAVMLHEIPQEIGDFAVLLYSGYSRRKALLLNFLTALSALLGAGLLFLVGQSAAGVTAFFVPIVAGGFIYIAVADLIPELQKTKNPIQSLFQFLALLVGVIAMLALAFFE